MGGGAYPGFDFINPFFINPAAAGNFLAKPMRRAARGNAAPARH
jgi:hypothetical protein